MEYVIYTWTSGIFFKNEEKSSIFKIKKAAIFRLKKHNEGRK